MQTFELELQYFYTSFHGEGEIGEENLFLSHHWKQEALLQAEIVYEIVDQPQSFLHLDGVVDRVLCSVSIC